MISGHPASVHDDEIDLLDLLHTVWRYKYLICATTIAGALVAVYLALSATPVYRAEIVVTEVADSSSASLAGQLGGLAGLTGLSFGRSGAESREARAVLSSRRLVEQFIKRNNLLPKLFPEAKEPPTLWMAVRYFRGGVLDIGGDELDGLTTVSIEWMDPAAAAQWANDFVALANDLLRARAIDLSTRNIAFLNQQAVNSSVVEVRRAMYNLIESETKTLMLAKGKADYAFAVVDPAVPPEIRISPRRTLMVLMGVLLGGFLGGIMAMAHRMTVKTRRRV